jgi:hypothetical protein
MSQNYSWRHSDGKRSNSSVANGRECMNLIIGFIIMGIFIWLMIYVMTSDPTEEFYKKLEK